MADTLDTLLNAAAVEEPSEIQTFDADVSFVSKLEDEPNDVGGMTSKELKEAFDQGGNTIKIYLNEVLIPALREYWKYDQHTRELMAKLSARFDQAVLGQIPDESIVTRMLAAEFYEHFHTKDKVLSAEVKEALELEAKAVPSDAFFALHTRLALNAEETERRARIISGSYVGNNGTITLTFPFKPLFFSCHDGGGYYNGVWNGVGNMYLDYANRSNTITQGISLTDNEDGTFSLSYSGQLKASNQTYYYTAIG